MTEIETLKWRARALEEKLGRLESQLSDHERRLRLLESRMKSMAPPAVVEIPSVRPPSTPARMEPRRDV